MGSNTWVRNGTSETSEQCSKKPRKMVWKRSDCESNQAFKEEVIPRSLGPAQRQETFERPPPDSLVAEDGFGPDNLETLSRKIESQKQELHRLQLAREEEHRNTTSGGDTGLQKEKQRQKLEAAFPQVFFSASEDAKVASSSTNTIADAEEVERVLKARTDYEVLQLHPGATAPAIRARYRRLAVQLHPDKCKVQGSAEAFGRIVTAHSNLLKYSS